MTLAHAILLPQSTVHRATGIVGTDGWIGLQFEDKTLGGIFADADVDYTAGGELNFQQFVELVLGSGRNDLTSLGGSDPRFKKAAKKKKLQPQVPLDAPLQALTGD